MPKSTTLSPEREAIRRYDRPRRLASNQAIVSAFMIILTAIILTFTVYAVTHATNYIYLLDGIFVVCLLLYGISFLAASRENLTLATIITVTATDATIVGAALIWITVLSRPSIGTPVDAVTFAQFTSLAVPIILAGVLGEPWLVIVTTLLMNVASLLFIFLIPIESTQPLFTVLVLGQEWAFTAITLTISRLYQRALGDLGQSYIQARQLDVLKDQFITNVNHELRTPVMTLYGYIEVLKLRYAQISPEQLGSALNDAGKTGQALLTLLNSILEVRNIDQELADFTPEAVAVYHVLDQALVLMDPREGHFRERQVHLQVPHHLTVWGEPVRLLQILTNLLSNAGKYSPVGSSIDVTATLTEDETGKGKRFGRGGTRRPVVHLTVRDYGNGIPPEQIPLLFNRFVRLPQDLASNVSGNGLGLYLCKIYAESMGGRIWAESTGQAGDGTTFHLVIPATEAPPLDDPQVTQPRMRVLTQHEKV